MQLYNKRVRIILAAALLLICLYLAFNIIYSANIKLTDIPERECVNINTADVSGLTMLDGVGQGLAERIISYREKNGKFEKAEDIMQVKGIGKRVFEKNRSIITV